MIKDGLFEKIDCVSFYVNDLEDGISFYADAMGLNLLWRTETSCGLGLRHGSTEIVLHTRKMPLMNVKVACVEKALELFLQKGGFLETEIFDTDVGKAAVVRDVWDNCYCLVDVTKGRYRVDSDGNMLVQE
ncbi:MAG: VOC family protein [bacterium]|nr:VOC family protein [bacterium]